MPAFEDAAGEELTLRDSARTILGRGDFEQGCGTEDTWVSPLTPGERSKRGESYVPVDAGPPYEIPKICVAPGLKDFEHAARDPELDFTEPLSFILAIQGKHASQRSKIVVKHDLEAAGNTMFFEAVNGYAVVSSGAILRSSVAFMFGRHAAFRLKFEKVVSRTELVEKKCE